MRPAARDQTLDAIREFHAEHGRLPRQREWERATPDRPCARTIERRWGWRELLAEAVGVEPDGLELWVEVIDDRAGRMLARAGRGARRARALAARRGVGAERAEAVAPDVRQVLRELGGGLSSCSRSMQL